MGRYNPEVHHRRAIRLQRYDYSNKGVYFVTICTEKRVQMFGEVSDGVMHVNERGEIAQRMWDTLPERFPGVELDAFIVMPNHIHGVLIRTQRQHVESTAQSQEMLETQETRKTPEYQGMVDTKGVLHAYRTHPQRGQMLNEMIRTFKAITSFAIRKSGTSAFAWQREYYETIIRSETQLDYVRAYIANNPTTWQDDTLHPNMFKPDV